MANIAKKTGFTADRISNLPISLLHHILSFLPAHEMVKTCIFSKKWRNVWFSAPSLLIDNLRFHDHPSTTSISFEQFVDFLLLTRDGSNVQNFSLYIESEPECDDSESQTEAQAVDKVDLNPSKVNAWILYALRHNVEVIELNSDMRLPPLLFSCESLRELRLSLISCHLDLTLPVNLPSLRVLHLNGVHIQAGQLDDTVFSAMPCLETLNLENCDFSQKKLSIVSTFKLTTLMMKGNFLAHFELSISAPNLKCLKLGPDGYSGSIKTIRFKNNSIQLTNANIESGVSCSESMIELFAVLCNTSSLKLSSSFLESFTSQLQHDLCIEDCIKTPVHNLTHMELGTIFSDDEALVINNILYHSPCIEVLRIVMVRNSPAVTVGECSEEEVVWSKFKLSRLKLVEIDDFQAVVNQIRFVKFLLENALVLEDMIIATPKYGYRNKQQLKLGRNYYSIHEPLPLL